MSDTTTPLEGVPAATPAAEPVAPAPAPEPPSAPASPPPAAEPTPEPAADPAAPAEPAPAIETPAPEQKPAHTDTPTALEEFAKPKEGEGEAKPAEAAPAAPSPTQDVATYEFTIPEGVTVDDARMGEFRTLLGQHHVSVEAAQPLFDLHTQVMTQYAEHLRNEQHSVFGATREGWRNEIRGDEELGGSGYETTMRAAARMRDLLVPESRREAFDQMLRVTGVGDHPEFIRLLHNAARLYDEPAMPSVVANPSPQATPRGQRGAVLYDHASSRKAAGR